MKLLILLLELGLLFATNGNTWAQNYGDNPENDHRPNWSLVIYASTDEEDLSHHSESFLQNLIEKVKVPDGVEVLMEQDTYGLNPVRRVIKGHKRKSVSYIAETDSANTEVFARFLNWSKTHATGKNIVLMILGHSWGWKGIIQDFALPGKPEEDSMMPVRVFADQIRLSKLNPQILLVDACITGNAEFIDEFSGIIPYLVASERETPYSGIPFDVFFNFMAENPTALQLAKKIPEIYVTAYARGGTMSKAEGEYGVVTMASIDMKKWDTFVPEFRALVTELKRKSFTQELKRNPEMFSPFVDMDFNMDMVEFLNNVNAVALRDSIVDGNKNSNQSKNEIVQLAEGEFSLLIQADEILAADLESKEFLKSQKNKLLEMNKDFLADELFHYSIEKHSRQYYLKVGGRAGLGQRIRPWLPGTKRVLLKQGGKTKELKRKQDYMVVDSFPSTSFFLATAMTQGAPFVHGIGLNMNPLMDEEEERGEDPITGLRGHHYYATISWNIHTHWGDLIHLNP